MRTKEQAEGKRKKSSVAAAGGEAEDDHTLHGIPTIVFVRTRWKCGKHSKQSGKGEGGHATFCAQQELRNLI
eukprot:6048445-Pleurochrysis_carterae.AAC.1